jgi:cation/acetate symporter
VRQGFADLPNALTPGLAVPDVWSQVSLVLGLLLGVAGLPHILIRFYTVKDAADAKKGRSSRSSVSRCSTSRCFSSASPR